ncbi:DUF4954 family protein, partial [Thermococcus sp. M36]|uniref:DUF6819 domain-containing protein n=1 Tax=Thermococcus sp. M36 TaxID=1638261 RepID=UPI00143C951D
YGIQQLIELIKTKNISSIDTLQNALPARVSREEWLNVGGQLLPVSSVNKLKQLIKTGKLSSWDAVHDYYTIEGNNYAEQKLKHALASFIEISKVNIKKIDKATLNSLLDEALVMQQWITENIFTSREKDYTNPFRKMLYNSDEEMNKVVGPLADNSFINQQKEELKAFTKEIAVLKKKLK